MEPEPTDTLVRDAVADDAAHIAVIGHAAFPDLHKELLEAGVIDMIVAQTYSVSALAECIARCARSRDAHFLVAERNAAVVGYLHYDSEGTEPELHRIYVDPDQKRGGIGTALLREHHRRIGRGSYILMVAAANEGAIAFYLRHGLIEDARVDAVAFYRDHMAVQFPPDMAELPALVLRYSAPA